MYVNTVPLFRGSPEYDHEVVEVKDGEAYVIGLNVEESADSRQCKCVLLENIIGRVSLFWFMLVVVCGVMVMMKTTAVCLGWGL